MIELIIGFVLLLCIIDSWAKSRRLNREMKEVKLKIEHIERVIY